MLNDTIEGCKVQNQLNFHQQFFPCHKKNAAGHSWQHSTTCYRFEMQFQIWGWHSKFLL